MAIRHGIVRRLVSVVGLSALVGGLLLVAPASAATIFQDDFTSGGFTNWTVVTRLTIDNTAGSPAAPSARGQVSGQSAYAYRNLASTLTQVCASANVNLASGTGVDLFRLRTSTGGAIVKAFVTSTGTLGVRSDFAATQRNSGVALGTGWNNVELCGIVGSASTWDLYRDGVRIVNQWAADTGTTAVGRIQIGDTGAKTFTVNFDHVVVDQAVGDEGAPPPTDTTPPTVPGRPTGSSPSTSSIQISWAASSDPSTPITYRVYRDGGPNPVGNTTSTSFTDTGLNAGSTHTYEVDAVDAASNASVKSQASAPITVQSGGGGGAGRQPVPNHTALAPQTPKANMPRITTGEIWDIEYIGSNVYIAGTFGSIQNNTATNTTSYNQPSLASYNIDTGLVNTGFRPTFGGGGVTEVEASPDGTRLYAVGSFNTVNGITRRKIVALNPTTGAVITGFTANANSQTTAVDATNTTVYVGGNFTAINGVARVGLAALNASTGAVITGFQNDLSGGVGVDGAMNVHAVILTHDNSRLLVVHTAKRVGGDLHTGVAWIDTSTNRVMPWYSSIWDDNLQFIGGIQRIYAGAISPDDSYFVVTAGSGGDRPPISDTAIAFPVDAGGSSNVQPLWVSRAFDSVYSVAISEVAVYIGGHFNANESPTAPDPWPGLTNVGYGRGQGIAYYGLGDDIVVRDHIGALDPATGKALEWNPGSNSYEGNKAMLVTPRGVFAGGDTNNQGGQNTGRIAFYDFNTVAAPGQNETAIIVPIEGRVEEADQPFTVSGTATATSGVRRVQLEVIERDTGQYLQDDLTTWGASNTIDVTLATPNATSTNWSQSLTISGNHRIMLRARTVGINGTNDATKAIKKIETFGLSDQTPVTNITGPTGSIIPTTTFTTTGTATDDFGVNAILVSFRDANNRYLQDDGTVDNVYNTFRTTPDVIGATNTTWSYEVTVPYEGSWHMQAIAVDTAGQSDLRSADRDWLVSSTAIPPSVSIVAPAVMNPPTATAPLTMAPGSPVTFSGSATDDQDLDYVEVSLRNSTTRENLGADCSWGTDVTAGLCRVGPTHISGSSYNWSYTTPFDLRPGTYTFTVRATDDLGLTTAAANRGTLTINVQVPGDNPPDTTISPTGTQPNLTSLHLNLAGTATDDLGVAAVKVSLRDGESGLYVQPNGTRASSYALLDATLGSPNATSTTWSLSLDLPATGNYSVTAIAVDSADQQDLSSTGATATYPAYPGDQPPAMVDNLFSPSEGASFTESRVLVSGRVEDDQQIAAAQVAIQDSLGRYLSSSGVFSSTTISWRTAYLNSPGSPGSNFAYTSPALPSGTYTVYARGVDQHGFATDPPYVRHVSVSAPPGNVAPVANFTVTCNQNVCSFDARSSTDDDPATLTYTWNFGNGTGSGPVPTRTYTSANTYTVTLTATDYYGVSSSISKTVTITEPAGNVAPTPVLNPPSCSGLVCNFSGVGSADPNVGDTFTYLWNFGDGTPTSTSSAPSHAFPSAGTYTVTLTVTDGWGRSASTTRSVTVA
jgi:PKD repeat protein